MFTIVLHQPWIWSNFFVVWELKRVITGVIQRSLNPFLMNTKFQLVNGPWSVLSDSPLNNVPFIFKLRQMWTAGGRVKHWDFHRHTKSFHNMMHWKDKIIRNLALETIFFNLLMTLWQSLAQSGELSLLGKTKTLVDAPFVPNTDNLTCRQLICFL